MAKPRRTKRDPNMKGIRWTLVNGRGVYRVELQRKKHRTSKIVDTIEEAWALKAQWLRESLPVRPPGGAAAAPLPSVTDETSSQPVSVELALEQYAEQLMEDQRPARSRVAWLVRLLARYDPDLLAMPVDAVLPEHFLRVRRILERPRAKRRGSGPLAANTIRSMLILLRAGIRRLRPEFHVAGHALPPEEDRIRFFKDDVEQILFETALEADPCQDVARIGQLMLWNVTRQQQWQHLRVDRVHLGERRIELPRSKGHPHVLKNVSDETLDLIRAQLATLPDTAIWLFQNPETGRPYSQQHIGRVIKRALRAAGRRDMTPHDLRHHAATTFSVNGANDRELQDLGGWRSTKMLPKYAHATSQRLAELNRRVSAREVAR